MEFAFATMQDDLRRLEHIPGAMYNFHPGSHVGQGEKDGIRLITEHLNRLFEEEFSATVLLETPNELDGYHKEILLLKSLYKAG